MKVRGKWLRLRVVVDLALVEDGAADAQIEDAGVALGIARRRRGNVGDAVLVHQHLHHGVVELHGGEIPLHVQQADDAHTHVSMLKLEDGRVRIGAGAVHGQAVDVQAERREMQGEILQRYLSVQLLTGDAVDLGQDVVVESLAVEQDGNPVTIASAISRTKMRRRSSRKCVPNDAAGACGLGSDEGSG